MDMDPDTYPTPEDEYAAALDFIDRQDDDDDVNTSFPWSD